MRSISDTNILKDFCEKFCNIVEKHCKYIIVSGYLVIASGRSRGTEDIDMILEKVSKAKFFQLHKELRANNFICIQEEDPNEIYEILLDNTSVRYIYNEQMLPEMELKFAKDILDQFQIDSRTKISETNVNVYFGDLNLAIAFKEEYLKSDKDLADAKHLRLFFKEKINEDKIKGFKKLIQEKRLK